MYFAVCIRFDKRVDKSFFVQTIFSAFHIRYMFVENVSLAFQISISNDGESFSDSRNVYVFDSTCQKIETMPNGNIVFRLKVSFKIFLCYYSLCSFTCLTIFSSYQIFFINTLIILFSILNSLSYLYFYYLRI